jgi:hypothetical protein
MVQIDGSIAMSEEMDDQHPSGGNVGRSVFRANVVFLVVIVLWAVSLPFGWFYTLLNGGVSLPREFTTNRTLVISLLVGPLALLNLFWLIYAARRWRERPPMSEPPRDHFSQQPSSHVQAKRGVS